jgi:hypothetical protein
MACYKSALIDLDCLMNMKDTKEIYIKIRNKFPPDILEPRILTEIIEILFEYIDESDSEANKAQG